MGRCFRTIVRSTIGGVLTSVPEGLEESVEAKDIRVTLVLFMAVAYMLGTVVAAKLMIWQW